MAEPTGETGRAGAGDVAQVIAELEKIVDRCRADQRRTGYFAAMYLAVTRQIAKAIEAGVFDDNERMARFDQVFAHRFIDAFHRHSAGKSPTKAWQVSFEGAGQWRPIIVQQLLTGMNAHINLDLGIAAATIAPGDELAGLQADFNRINDVLASMTAGFVADVARVSPWIALLDKIGGRTEQHLIKFSIDVARNEAWNLAQTLAPLPDARWGLEIAKRDAWTADFGGFLIRPGFWLSIGLFVIRVRESNDVDRVIDLFLEATARSASKEL